MSSIQAAAAAPTAAAAHTAVAIIVPTALRLVLGPQTTTLRLLSVVYAALTCWDLGVYGG